MARKPNYQFERMERERLKAGKAAAKANARREERERAQPSHDGATDSADPKTGES